MGTGRCRQAAHVEVLGNLTRLFLPAIASDVLCLHLERKKKPETAGQTRGAEEVAEEIDGV